MRVLKKSKKNPTFNEYFPVDKTGELYMFDDVFSDTELKNKILSLFAKSVLVENFKFSFELNFRALYGDRQVDDTIINNPFSEEFENFKNYY